MHGDLYRYKTWPGQWQAVGHCALQWEITVVPLEMAYSSMLIIDLGTGVNVSVND